MSQSHDDQEYGLDTLAVHAGQVRTQEGEMSEPIFASTSYVFASAAEAAARFSGEKPGNIYSRFTNPTVRVFEQRIAAMEGGERAVATGPDTVELRLKRPDSTFINRLIRYI